MKAKCPISCRDMVLDAAEEVVLKLGVGSFTLDAVAAHAKVSKGGLLYHYPSKDALLEAMVLRTVEQWREDYSAAIDAEPPGPCRVPRAILKMCMASPKDWTSSMRRSGAVLVAAIAYKPELVKPMREVYSELFRRVREEDSPSAVGELVVLAIDGLWFEWIFGLGDMTPPRLESLRSTLAKFVQMHMDEPTCGEPRLSGSAPHGRDSAAVSQYRASEPGQSGRVGANGTIRDEPGETRALPPRAANPKGSTSQKSSRAPGAIRKKGIKA